MCIALTVAIPTYNGATRLPKVLERLRSQIGTENFSWEILIVDNNSTDNTAKLVEDYQANWSAAYALRHCFEPNQGIGFARQRAIQEARGELVAFVDDDNFVAPNWVSEACKFAQEHPNAGAFGGKIHGKFDVEPPESLKKIIFYLAIIDRGVQPVQYQPRKIGVPPGAGLVVRRNAWQENVPSKQFFTGRVGSSLISSEDEEALLYIHRGGWEIWYNPAMEMEHLIPSGRLEISYFLNLMRGIGFSRHYIRMLSLPSWQRPFAFVLYLVNDTRKVILHFLRYRGVMERDLLAACEMERLISILISPFYLWKWKMRN